MKYTEHFDDKTDPKIMNGEKNVEAQNKLKIVLTELDKARIEHGKPFKITSGYRSPEYNKIIGGAAKSQHQYGEAVDFQSEGNLFNIFRYIYLHLEYDQVIYESREGKVWIHFSLKEKDNRNQSLIAIYNSITKKYHYEHYQIPEHSND